MTCGPMRRPEFPSSMTKRLQHRNRQTLSKCHLHAELCVSAATTYFLSDLWLLVQFALPALSSATPCAAAPWENTSLTFSPPLSPPSSPTPPFFIFFMPNSPESFSGKQAALGFMTPDPLLLAEPRPRRKEPLFSGYRDTDPGRRRSAISCCSTPLPSPCCPAKYHLVFDFSPTMAFSRRTAALRSAGLACRPVLFPLFK